MDGQMPKGTFKWSELVKGLIKNIFLTLQHSQVASPLHLLKGNLPLILLLVLLTAVNVAAFLGTLFVCHRKCGTRKGCASEKHNEKY